MYVWRKGQTFKIQLMTIILFCLILSLHYYPNKWLFGFVDAINQYSFLNKILHQRDFGLGVKSTKKTMSMFQPWVHGFLISGQSHFIPLICKRFSDLKIQIIEIIWILSKWAFICNKQ